MSKTKQAWIYVLTLVGLVGVPAIMFATEEAETGHGGFAMTFLWIAVILIAAKISSLVEKIGQPSVLGELVMGVILGNLVLIGVDLFEPIKQDSIIEFLSELGVVILLFQIGLESNISEMKKVGVNAFLVAIVGVVVPFVSGAYIIGPWLLPNLDPIAYLFLGASLTATSVGITARVFQELNKLKTKEAQIVLGAAVIDDVLGLIILAVVSAIAAGGTVTAIMVGGITLKAILFLVGAIVLGQLFAPRLSQLFAKIQAGVGMKFTLAIAFALLFAWGAAEIGLAAIVGAFAAGLVLDPVHFRYFKDAKVVQDVKRALKHADAKDQVIMEVNSAIEEHSHRHIEDLIQPISYFLVPIFFVFTGMAVNLETMFDPKILGVALAITVVAVLGKICSGFVAGKVNKAIVGFGMVPRGEVGLIFAAIGKGLGVVSDEVFSIIVIMVILTTLMTPPILAALLKRQK